MTTDTEPTGGLCERLTTAIINDLAQSRPDAPPDDDERQAARELAEVLAPIAESAVERLHAERDVITRNYESLQALAMRLEAERDEARVQAGRLRDKLATAINALYWVEYELSKHADHYGGDIEDAYDTARDAYRSLTAATEAS